MEITGLHIDLQVITPHTPGNVYVKKYIYLQYIVHYLFNIHSFPPLREHSKSG